MNRNSLMHGVRVAFVFCGLALSPLSTSAQTFLGTNAPGSAQDYAFTPGPGATNLAVSVAGSGSTYSHLLLRAGLPPTDADYDFLAQLDGAGNAINLEPPEFKLTNYFARVRTPLASQPHLFTLNVVSNVLDVRNAARPATKPLVSTNTGGLFSGNWHYYRIEIPTNNFTGWRVQLNSTNGAGPDLYIQRDGLPTSSSFLKRSQTTTNDIIAFAGLELTPGAYFIGVLQPSGSSTYTLRTEFITFTPLSWDPGTTHLGTQVYTPPDTNGGDFYFKVTVQNTALGAWRTALNVTGGEARIYLAKGGPPAPNSNLYKSERTNSSNGFVVPASAFSAGEDWYYLVQASPGAQWNLVTGEPFVTDLGVVAADAASGSGNVVMGAEGMRFFKTSVPGDSPAWRLYLNGQTNQLLVKKGGVPVTGASDLSQGGQMLVVPPYLVGGLLYFVGVAGAPGLTNNLDSRQQSFVDIPFVTATNLTVTGYPYRTFRVQVPFDQLAWQLSSLVSTGNPNIAVRRNFIPNENYNDAYSEVASNITDSITLVPPTLSDGTFYVTVYSTNDYTCQLTSGDPEFTEINYVDTVSNQDTNRTGWRFFKVSSLAQQQGTLGWDLYLTNHVPGTRIAVRRNAAPGIWNYRDPNPKANGAVDALGVAHPSGASFLQRPAHQGDIWYVGVFNTNDALGAFTLVTKELTAETISFDTGSSPRDNVPNGKWQFFRVDVPTNTLGWDARVLNVTQGSPRVIVRREILPISQANIGFNLGYGVTNWVTGDQFACGSDFTRRDQSSDGTQNEAGRILVMGYNRPLDAGTYYIGVISATGSTNDLSYTFLSRGIGPGYAIPVVDVPYTNGQVANALPSREIAVYRVNVPSNVPSWKFKVANSLGDSSICIAKDRVPNIVAGTTGNVTNSNTTGKRQGRIGNEHFVQLPGPGRTNLLAGDYYVIVQSEGQINSNPTNTTRIGPGDTAYNFISYGPMPEIDLGLLTTNEFVYTTALEGGEAAALHFQNELAGDATGFELNLDPVNGNPALVSRPWIDLADPGSPSVGGGGVLADPYGNDGGQTGALNASYDILTVSDPFSDETVMLKPRGAGNYWPDSDFTLRIRKLVPAPIAFDGGVGTVVTQTNLYEFFKIEVPTNALGWDIRLTNVIGSPVLILGRDFLPLNINTGFLPGKDESWFSGDIWIAARDWTQRSQSAAGVNEDGRIIACGMGRPLEPGTYYAAVYNSSGNSVSYSILSRGIGAGFSIPVTDIPFAGGSITNLALAPREAAYYRLIIPAGATNWQGRLTTLGGESLLLSLTNSIPGVLCGRPNSAGLAMQKSGNEHFVALPLNGTNVLLPGTNYFAVVSEGVTNVSFPTRIGTNVSSYIFESRGSLQVLNLGMIGTDEVFHTNSLQGGEVQAYQFEVPGGTTSLEARIYTSNGIPVQVLRVGSLFPSPGAASTISGAGSVIADAYGSDGGQNIAILTGNANTNLITVANPTNGTYSILVKARGAVGNYAGATYAIGVRALAYTDVAFDGGNAVVTNHAPNTWRYYKVEVPANIEGWDLRLANVAAGLPKMVVRRDTLPSALSTTPWSSPGTTANWPTTNQWAAIGDWTRRTSSANGATNEDGRILAMGLGQPLEPGTYWIGVFGTGGTNAMQYTVLSRGIGDGLSIPVTSLNYANGSATVSNLPPREAAYFRVQVPTNSPGWKLKLTPAVGEAMMLVLSNAIPNVDSGRINNARAGKLLQKAGNEHHLLLPFPGQTNIYGGTYYLAVVSEGVNPATSTRIGTDSSTFTVSSLGSVPVINLGLVTATDIVSHETLEGGEGRHYQFEVPPGTPALEVRLENRIGNPVMVLITNTFLPDPGGLSSPKDTYGNDGGDTPDLINTNIITVANPLPGVFSLAVKARVAGTVYPDASYTLRVRALPVPQLNFTAEFNTNGFSNVAGDLLLDSQRAYYQVLVPTNVHGQPVLGWGLDLAQLSGVASVRVRKDELPSDTHVTTGMPLTPNAAVIVPPFLTPGTWYVEVKGSNSTSFTLTSSSVQLQRPAWAMPPVGGTNSTPGLTLPEFGDSGVGTNGAPLPGDQGVDLELGKYHYYAITIPTNNGGLLRVQLEAISGNPNFYVRSGDLPTVSHRTNGVPGQTFDRAVAGSTTEYGNFVPIDGKKEWELASGTWYCGVHAANANARYRLRLSTGQVQELALDGGSLSGQVLAGNDWRYYRVQIPETVPTNWVVTFSQEAGDVVLHVRDTVPPGNGVTNSVLDIRDWTSDAKNSGPYGSFDPAGSYSFTVPPVRLGSVYYLGFRAKSDSTFSVSSGLVGSTNALWPIIPFYGGSVSNVVLPPGEQLGYRILTPPEALRWRHTSVHAAAVQYYIENGTWPRKSAQDDFRSTSVNSSQDRLLTVWPWLPGQTFYMVVTNTSGATQSFSFTMNGSGVADDSDGDGMTDGWELEYFGSLAPNGSGDFDGDGVNNGSEFQEGTNPADKASLRPRLTVVSTNGVVSVGVTGGLWQVTGTAVFTNLLLTQVACDATPSNGFDFVGWVVGGVKLAANPLLLSLTSNTLAVARFRVPADDFDQRIGLSGFVAGSSGLANQFASKEPGEPNHGGNIGGRSLWWSWTAPLSGAVTLGTAGTFRHALAVYTGGAVNALVTVTNRMAGSGEVTNGLTFNAVGGVTYQIAVDGFNGAFGVVDLSLSQAGALVLSNPVRLGDGLFHFTITSAAGAVLTIQASTNLVDWTQIAVVTNVSGTMDFADPASATLPLRYYRVGPAGGAPGAMTIAGAVRLPDGNLRITVNGSAGQVFRVLANTNLATGNWLTLATLTNVGGSLQYTDTAATNHAMRFYRTVSP